MPENKGQDVPKAVHAFGPPQAASDTDAGLLTREELLAGFLLTHSDADASQLTEGIWSDDIETEVFFWSDDTLIRVSLVSEELAARIRQRRGWTREHLAALQEEFRRCWRL